MKEEIINPLDLIFHKNSEGETNEEIEDIQKIPEFFNYLRNEEIETQEKINIIEKLQKKFNSNRHLIEFFSQYENISIFIFLFDLFLSKNTTEDLKKNNIKYDI